MNLRLAICAAIFAASPAFAADPVAPLPRAGASHAATTLKPGKSAGVQRAQMVRGGLALVGGGGVIAGIAVAVASGGGGAGNSDRLSPQMNSVTTGTP
ncbi:MAG TPA: hypothetical protein VGM26_10030 [Rhizomicrobium sp.]|jgi:hypothetical protein